MTAGIVEDIVVDLTLEVDPSVTAEELARSLTLPGVEILRSAAATTIWLTVLVASDSEADAVRTVRDAVVSQIPQATRVLQAAVLTSAPLGDLHACLDAADEDPASMSVRDLVEQHLWTRGASGRPRSTVALGRRRVG